jgi:hypothetical protein
MTGSGGRSSIPETPMMESRGRNTNILDRPVKPDDDSFAGLARRVNESATNV